MSSPDAALIAQGSTSLRNPIVPKGNVPPGDAPLGDVSVPFVSGPPTSDAPDPWIVYHSGYYYLTYTSHAAPNTTVPLEIRKARTLGGLASAQKEILWPRPGDEVPEGEADYMWAPELHRLQSPEDGAYHWYVYYAPGNLFGGSETRPIDGKRMAVLESDGDDPMGPYHYKAAIAPLREDVDILGEAGEPVLPKFGIDATVFTNFDGRLYYIYSGVQPSVEGFQWQSLYIAEMENPWTLKTDPVLISTPAFPWERVGVPTNEGPVVLRRDGQIHLIYSASFCSTDGYSLGRISVDETADLLNPQTWLLAKHPLPVFYSSPQNGIYGPGHNGFFKSPDGTEDWMVFHAHTAPGSFATGGACGGVRTAHVQKISFDGNGVPVFGEPLPLNIDLIAPSGDPTINYQFEDALIADYSLLQHRVVGDEELQGDRQLVGLRALAFDAEAPGDFIRFSFTVPESLTYSIRVRTKIGPDRGRFVLSVSKPDGTSPSVLGEGDTYDPAPGTTELNFGAIALKEGDQLFTFTATAPHLDSSGLGFTLDQIRLIASGRE